MGEVLINTNIHSYFDAQIWATARLNQVPTIFTEDFTNGRRLEGVSS